MYYLIRPLSLYWIAGDHTIHPITKRLLASTSTEPIPFQNPASKAAVLQVHATTPECKTTGWFQGWLSLSSFRVQSNEHQELLVTLWNIICS